MILQIFKPYKDILFYWKYVALKTVLLDRGVANECRTQTQTKKKQNKIVSFKRRDDSKVSDSSECF